MALQIRPVKKADDHRKIAFPRPLMDVPFQLYVLGGCGSGKTNAVVNLVFSKTFFRDVFDNIILFSPSVHSDTTMHPFLKSSKVRVVEDYSEDALAGVLADMKAGVEDAVAATADPPQTLLIFDDMLGEFSKNSPNLKRLATKFRHHCCSVIYTSQVFKEMPTNVRINLTAAMLFHCPNEAERGKVIAEFSSWGGGRLGQLWDEVTIEPYQFLLLHKDPMSAYASFGRQIWSLKDDQERRRRGAGAPQLKQAAGSPDGDGGASS